MNKKYWIIVLNIFEVSDKDTIHDRYLLVQSQQ